MEKVSEAATGAGFRPRVLGHVPADSGSIPILSLSRKIPGRAPRILIAAGIHGDEPAGPHAVLALLEQFAKGWESLHRLQVEIVPLINPSGFDRRERHNVAGTDPNRTFGSPAPPPEIRLLMDDYRRRPIDLFIDLHEDVDTPGFYLYELAPDLPSDFGPHVISALQAAGHPINLSPVIEGMAAVDGLILRTSRNVPRYFRQGAPQGLYMKRLGTRRTLTFESPPRLPLPDRVAMQLLALQTVVDLYTR
ncbi:MAG: M14 family metallopeptidase [Leptospirillia bacterium]